MIQIDDKTHDDIQAQITLRLSGKGQAIEDYLDNPSSNQPIAGLEKLASDVAAAARLTTEIADRIRYLSYQLRTLLKEEAGND